MYNLKVFKVLLKKYFTPNYIYVLNCCAVHRCYKSKILIKPNKIHIVFIKIFLNYLIIYK